MAGAAFNWAGGTGDIASPANWLGSPSVTVAGNAYVISAGEAIVMPATAGVLVDDTIGLAGTDPAAAPAVLLQDGADFLSTLRVDSAASARFGTVSIQGAATFGTPTAPSSGIVASGVPGSAISVVLGDAARLTLLGPAAIIAAGNFFNAGNAVSIGGAADGALLLDSGDLSAVNQSTLAIGVAIASDAGFAGTIQVSSGATVDLQRSVAASETALLFGGLLELDDPAQFSAPITAFQAGATLELSNITVAHVTSAFDPSTLLEELTLLDTGGSVLTLRVPFSEPYTVANVGTDALITEGTAGPADPGGPAGGGTPTVIGITPGTESIPGITGNDTLPVTPTPTGTPTTPATVVATIPKIVTVECFLVGTRIATEYGEMPVEALRPGMHALTRSGLRPVRWVGRRRLDLSRHADAAAAAPLCIRADAFGPGRPYRDLLLSPDHAIYFAGALIPVRCLANGATIAREDRAAVVYHHVELDRHDILFAEGLPVESFLDTGNRSAFEGEAALDLHPCFGPKNWTSDACAKLLTQGAAVAAERARLRARAEALGFLLTTDPGLCVRAGARTLAVARDGYPLPGGVRTLRLCSRRVVPKEIDPESDDRRRLGLALRGVWFDERPADARAFGAGFYPPEPDGPRWTDGDAVLHVPDGARRLRLGVDIWQRYWERSDDAVRLRAAAG